MGAVFLLVGRLAPYNEAIGFWAAFLTTAAFAPQVIRTWRKGGDDLSWAMLMLFGLGVGLWFVYGFLRRSTPIVLANGATGLQVLLILAIKGWRAARMAGARQS